MPNLLLFTPCERAIVSKEDGTSSLIAILEQVTIALPAEAVIPEGTIVPLKWYVFAMWQQVPEDEGKQYEQRVQIILPDGHKTSDLTMEFTMTERLQRNLTGIAGFPARVPGEAILQLSLREIGGSEWREIATYPLQIVLTDQVPEEEGSRRL